MEYENKHVVWHRAAISRQKREALNGHRSAILWFTGLSGAGKSTLAHAVEERLYLMGCRTFVLDGDNVRHGLCADLGFSDQDRRENIRRIAEVAKLMLESGVITLTAFISPFRAERLQARNLVAAADFIEIYCRCDLAVCERRDTKGFYQKARLGEIKWFTGISSPYEVPQNPDLIVETGRDTLQECVDKVMVFLAAKGVIRQSQEVGEL